MEKLALSVTEVSQLVGISRTSIYIALTSGDLIARKVGRRTVILRADVELWLKRRPAMLSKVGGAL
jgi:excisionase family DNA binding protein